MLSGSNGVLKDGRPVYDYPMECECSNRAIGRTVALSRYDARTDVSAHREAPGPRIQRFVRLIVLDEIRWKMVGSLGCILTNQRWSSPIMCWRWHTGDQMINVRFSKTVFNKSVDCHV